MEIRDNNGCSRITRDHKRAKRKADGVIAGVLALGVYPKEQKNDMQNVYEERGYLDF